MAIKQTLGPLDPRILDPFVLFHTSAASDLTTVSLIKEETGQELNIQHRTPNVQRRMKDQTLNL